MIVIVDYGMGNLGSISNMLRKIGVEAVRSGDHAEIAGADKLILPGVGAFDQAMLNLNERGLITVLNQQALERRVPVLGICLGMQILGRSSEEGSAEGLGWIDADIKRFNFSPALALPVPHMGWNRVRLTDSNSLLTSGMIESRFYFAHSFYLDCNDQRDVVATCEYGTTFPAVIQSRNIFGVQFHPEKSHRFGMKLLQNFTELC